MQRIKRNRPGDCHIDSDQVERGGRKKVKMKQGEIWGY